MNSKQVSLIKLLVYFYASILVLSCRIADKNDIYKQIPKGSKLSDTILRRSKQIIYSGNDILIIYDLSKEWDVFAPHILFYNSDLELYSACYLPSDKIDSIKGNRLYIEEHNILQGSKMYSRKNLPGNFEFIAVKVEKLNGSINRSYRIIQGISLSHEKNQVTIYSVKSNNFWTAYQFSKAEYSDSSFLREFKVKDTSTYSLTDITFDFPNGIIQRRFLEDHTLIRDNMLILNKRIIDSLIYSIVKSKN